MVNRVAVAVAVGLLAVAATASGALRHGGVRANIYTLDVATGRIAVLTANPEAEEDKLAYAPSWSPNGRQIVYAETRCHACASEIRVTRIAPRPAPLGRRIAFGFHPRWSPNGTTIAFVDPTGNIETIGVDGTGRRVVARGGLANDDPAWSPDGRTLAFARQLTATAWSIYVVPAAGGTPHQLTRGNGQTINPAWSPNGNAIAFARRRADGRWEIAVASRDGTQARRLSDATGSDSSPAWSPDGRRIVFVREQGLEGDALYVMSARGGRAKRLTPRSLVAVQPQWSPRGTLVAFSGRTTGND